MKWTFVSASSKDQSEIKKTEDTFKDPQNTEHCNSNVAVTVCVKITKLIDITCEKHGHLPIV